MLTSICILLTVDSSCVPVFTLEIFWYIVTTCWPSHFMLSFSNFSNNDFLTLSDYPMSVLTSAMKFYLGECRFVLSWACDSASMCLFCPIFFSCITFAPAVVGPFVLTINWSIIALFSANSLLNCFLYYSSNLRCCSSCSLYFSMRCFSFRSSY